jgi:hypothetical protein
MPAIRNILSHVCVETAAKKRRCRREPGRSIVKGERCLVIKTGPTNDPYSYSRQHAKAILDSAWANLESLYADLDLTPPDRASEQACAPRLDEGTPSRR